MFHFLLVPASYMMGNRGTLCGTKNPAPVVVPLLSLTEDLNHQDITCLGLLSLLLPPVLIFPTREYLLKQKFLSTMSVCFSMWL